MRNALAIIAIVTGLAACTAADEKEMEKNNDMEAKARDYCSITKGHDIGGQEYMLCTEHYVQGYMDAAKKK